MSKVMFDINKFAVKFKEIVCWMIEDDTYGDKIRDDLQFFKSNKEELQLSHDSPKALRLIVELMVTQAWYYRKPEEFENKMDCFIGEYGKNFRTSVAKEKLIGLVEDLAPPRIKSQARESIKKLLYDYSSIRDFSDKLYVLAKLGKTVVLGDKGRDNYLRDFGYWDRIPIDRHEMRFIIRTGIYHTYSDEKESDPLQRASLQGALARFCSKHLNKTIVEGINLGDAPGVVDIFIWSYCGKERYNICGSSPKCNNCKLKYTCLYNLSKAS